MKDIDFVEGFKTSGHLNESLPYFRLVEVSVKFEVVIYFFLDISSVSDLHDDA